MSIYQKIYKHQKETCFYCNEKTNFSDLEEEHVFPRSKLGRGIKNKVLACKFCNRLKGNLIIKDFKIKVEKLLIDNIDDNKTIKLNNILLTLSKLEIDPEIRKGWHRKAHYYANNINEQPKNVGEK